MDDNIFDLFIYMDNSCVSMPPETLKTRKAIIIWNRKIVLS